MDYGPFQLSHGTTYTESGRKKSLTYPDGSTYEYSYNEANRIQSVDLPESGQITWGEYEWRRPTKIHLPGGASKIFNLDPLQRLKEITSRDPAGNTVLHREYDYDKAGNIVSESNQAGTHHYGYDPLDRLTKAENPALPDEEYSYDAVGNRLTSADTNGTWSYNSNNELLAYNNATCSFDDNGNMVKRVINGQVTRYIYNANNRLVRVEDGSGDVIAEYYYDPFGRRLWKKVNGERTYFHYSEQGLIGEFDSQGDPIRFYGYKPGSSWTTDPLFLKKDGNYYFYHNDHLGTPQKLTARNGRVVWSARYASFGGTQLVEKEIKNPLRFPGQYYDKETGLHYNYHRYYDPKIGRYSKVDPIGMEGGINVFIYTFNNPLAAIDPNGLKIVGLWFRKPYVENMDINGFTNIDWDFESSDKTFGPVRFGYLNVMLAGDVGFTVYCKKIDDRCGNIIRDWYVSRKWDDISKRQRIPIQINAWPSAVQIWNLIKSIAKKDSNVPPLINAAKKKHPVLKKSPSKICKLYPNG